MIAYKLTDAEGKTRNGMEWAIGKTNRPKGAGTELCSDGFIHVYETPLQAVFMRPVHVPDYSRLFEVEVPEIALTDGTKCGVKEATAIREISLPTLTTEQRVEIAIRAALQVYHDPAYIRWAEKWLNGSDRSYAAADAAYAAADAAAHAAAHAAYAASYAAHAARAAYDAADVADYAAADVAARAAADVAARAAAYDAAYAAYASAHDAADKINLIGIIDQVVNKALQHEAEDVR